MVDEYKRGGVTSQAKDRIEKAMELTEQMLEINPNNPSAHFYLSYIYRYAGMLTESKKFAEKAIETV